MSMVEEQTSVSVSALRAQIQERLGFGRNPYEFRMKDEDSTNSPPSSSRRSSPIPPAPPKSPPIPPHRIKSDQTLRTSGGGLPLPPRPPPPPHGKPTLSEGSMPTTPASTLKRASTSPMKPPVAPKPVILRKTSAISALSGSTILAPAIVVDDFSESPRDDGFESSSSHRLSSNDSTVSDCAKTTTVEEPMAPRSPVLTRNSGGTEYSTQSARPDSIISSTSITSTNSADMSDTDSDDDQPGSIFRNSNELEHNSSTGKIGIRRPSALAFNSDPKVHSEIMDELKRQGIVRASTHTGLYKKRNDGVRLRKPPARPPPPVTSSTSVDAQIPSTSTASGLVEDGTIPDDVGKLRDDKKNNRIPEVSLSVASSTSASDESADRSESTVFDTSSLSAVTVSTEHDQDVRDYDTGDPEEDKRLRRLHFAANEFYDVQKRYVKYLDTMASVYPEYMKRYGEKVHRDLIAFAPVVTQLSTMLSQLLTMHKFFLEEFTKKYAAWDSENPSIAEILLKNGDILKMCRPFLQEKTRFITELLKLREDKDFSEATRCFEEHCLKMGPGGVVQQLDQVHQNFMRYKLLLDGYKKYLKKDTEEYAKTIEAIDKLEKITQSVNQSMGLPSNEELVKLYDRFQCQFNVFHPGRRLIRQDECVKQSRNKEQPRFLVLFSDFLWVCRVQSGLLQSGEFDVGRSYRIQVDHISFATEAREHEDFENYLRIKTKERAFNLKFRNGKIRREWEHDLAVAKEEKKRYKRRMSEAIDRQRRQSSTPVIAPASTFIEELPSTSTSNGLVNGPESSLSTTSTLVPADSSPSAPSTPVDEGSVTSFNGIANGTRKIKKVLRVDREKPVWIPDEESSKCLMDGCGSEFGLIHRRHHCRDCGYLICKKCCAEAPLAKYDFQKKLVCPECYDRILQKYCNGELFPPELLVTGSDGTTRVKIKKNNGKTTLVVPRELLSPPQNVGLRKMVLDDRIRQSDDLVFSRVFRRTRDGEVVRFAQLTNEMILKFFKARLDSVPCEQPFIIHGFELREQRLDEGGCLFELVHRNQIQTDRKEEVIAFRVENGKSIDKWSTKLRMCLGEPKQDSADEADEEN